MNLYSYFSQFNHVLTFYLVFPAILFLSLFLTVKLKFLQITKMKLSFLNLFRANKKGAGNISHYQAISAVIAGNLGTGNISGMAIALAMGGPGSLVWMWLMAFFGSILQYSSCYLGVKYRTKNSEGEYIGGPMYYLKNGLGLKKTSVFFAIFTLIAAVLVGNFAQVNSAMLPLQALGIHPLICGFSVMVLAALVTLGGLQRVAKVASSVVPAMAILYIGAGVIVLFFYKEQVVPALFLMLKSSFQLTSFAGGAMGFGLMKALSTGLERGVFATDAGTGVGSILQSGARSQHPVLDGVVTLVAPFLVMLICTMTGLILIVTGAFEQSGLQSTNMVVFAFQKVFGQKFGMSIVFCSLFLFAYTTILAWGGCGEKAAEFLWNKKMSKVFQYGYLALLPIGSILRVDLIWVLADLSIALMLITNLVGIAGLSKEVVAGSLSFFAKDVPSSSVLEAD
jgi:alanine or glycine:cation symporter, AGCS family